MIGLTRAVRVFAYGAPVDLRKGFNGLSALVEHEMKHRLVDGDVYLLVGRKPRRAKVLYFDGTGLFSTVEKLADPALVKQAALLLEQENARLQALIAENINALPLSCEPAAYSAPRRYCAAPAAGSSA